MRLVDVRIEGELKSLIQRLSSECGRSMNDVAQDLVRIGIDIQRQGGVKIVGPLGIGRPFAAIIFSGELPERLGLWISEELAEEVKSLFGDVREGIREAMRLGVLALDPLGVKVVGPFRTVRPFAKIRMPQLKDEKAREAYRRLRSARVRIGR